MYAIRSYCALDIVVLAAGQGKRMYSSLPKVLHKVAGRPMLAHVLETARALSPGRIIVVHGHGGDEVRSAFAAMNVTWVEQTEQLGTVITSYSIHYTKLYDFEIRPRDQLENSARTGATVADNAHPACGQGDRVNRRERNNFV